MLRRLLAVTGIATLVILGSASSASADDKETAKERFLAGGKAFEAGDYRAAATAFEEAYRIKHHHDPLWNAARAWDRAGESVRAANLYAKYLREAPAGAVDRNVATTALAELSRKLGKIVARSTGPVHLRVDDADAETEGLYVEPGEHVVSGDSGEVPVKKTVTVAAGQTLSVTLEPLEPAPAAPPSAPTPPAPPPKAEGFRLPWIVVAVGGALALAGGGLTIWSGLDTNAQRDRFDRRYATGEANQDDLDEGHASERRTNIFLAATIGLTVLTGASALFVDWGSNSKRSGAFVQPGFGTLAIGYRR